MYINLKLKMQAGKNKNEINLELDEIPEYLRASIQKIIDMIDLPL